MARTTQRHLQFPLKPPGDEGPNLLANTFLQRIEPVRAQNWTIDLGCDIFRRDVISSGGANRRPGPFADAALVWDRR